MTSPNRSSEPDVRAALAQLAEALRRFLHAKEKHYAAMQETARQRARSVEETTSPIPGDSEAGASSAWFEARARQASYSAARDAAELDVFRALEAVDSKFTHEPLECNDPRIQAYFELAYAVRRWRDRQAIVQLRLEEARRLDLDPVAKNAFCRADLDAFSTAYHDAIRWLDTIDGLGAWR